MRKLLLVACIGCLTTMLVFAQTPKKAAVYSVAFYNLENLFDTIDQPDVLDEEYTPTGGNRWTAFKYNNKQKNMSHVLAQLAIQYCPQGPAFIGVSEIENRGVLEDLVNMPELVSRNYGIVHYDSPDRRGVDVGLLYNPALFTVENHKSYRLTLPDDPRFLSRDQLVVSGRIDGERVHVIVNHWPSRLGGEKKSRPKREAAAALSKHITDSLLSAEPQSIVFVMGDLNDDPMNTSCAKVLNAKRNVSDVQPGGLYNPFWNLLSRGVGSLAYQGSWNLFDQIIVSSQALTPGRETLTYWKAEVFNAEFLKQKEGKYKGYPLRTHAAGVYLNGYSDHFPTIMYLVKEVE